MELSEILETMRGWPAWSAYCLLFGGAFIEYIVPMLPGDTIVVAGAVLVAAFGWDFAPVYLVVTLGAVVGSIAAFYVGRWLLRSGKVDKLGPNARQTVAEIAASFRRRGAWYLAVNRFLPGIRGLFFVAAGVAELRPLSVALWSALSAAAWNALLVGAGFALGDNLEALEETLTGYAVAIWVAIGLVAVVVAWRLRRRVTRNRTKRNDRM